MCHVMKLVCILLAIFPLVLNVCAAEQPCPFRLPALVAEKRVDTSGKTWQMTGTATNAFADVRNGFYASFKESGYVMRHEIPMDKSGQRILSAWKKGGRELILMLWPIDRMKFGFAWGETDLKMKGGSK